MSEMHLLFACQRFGGASGTRNIFSVLKGEDGNAVIQNSTFVPYLIKKYAFLLWDNLFVRPYVRLSAYVSASAVRLL